MKRNASATWTGDLKSGKGAMSTQTGVLSKTPFSFTTRFENEPGTNPEELVAAALSGCFSMALAADLGRAGFEPERVETSATLSMEKTDKGWTTTEIVLDVTAKVPKLDASKLEEVANGTRQNCPMARLLDTKITVKTRVA